MSIQAKIKPGGDLLKQIASGEISVRVSPGEVWQLGRHRLMCGDSLDEATINRLLDGQQPGLVWSDPPYGIKIQHKDGRVGGGSRGRVCSFNGKVKAITQEARAYPIIAGDTTIDTAVAALHLHLDLFPKAAHCWWGANHYADGLPPSPCWIVWDKLNGKTNFADCELAWTNQKTALRKFEWRWSGFVKRGIASQEKRMHPNQKPVEMVEWFWQRYTPTVELCFDPFLGSGTSMIAAERLGRSVYGCELMPEYCEVILQRWEHFTGEKATLVGTKRIAHDAWRDAA